ncbi:hypothetical protein ABDX79_08550 [Fulvimarina sp. MAC3]
MIAEEMRPAGDHKPGPAARPIRTILVTIRIPDFARHDLKELTVEFRSLLHADARPDLVEAIENNDTMLLTDVCEKFFAVDFASRLLVQAPANNLSQWQIAT